MIVTAAHVVLVPNTGLYKRDLRFYCGMHGKQTKSAWCGKIKRVMHLEGASKDQQILAKYPGFKMEQFPEFDKLKFNSNFDLAVVQVEPANATQKEAYKNWVTTPT